LIHPDDLGAIRGSSEALAKGEIDMFQVEYRCRHKNGSWRYLEGIARRYDDDSVDLHGIIVNSRDVTDRKSAERQLRSYTAKLEQSNRELQEFAYVASHDLQEPLRKVQAFGDRLEKKCAAALSDEGRDYVGRMRNAAGRMQNLINDLLTFSRVATKTQPFRGVDLKRIVEEVASDLEVRIEQTGGRVEIGELPLIDADAANAPAFSKPDRQRAQISPRGRCAARQNLCRNRFDERRELFLERRGNPDRRR
jgi:signal transduction histidine kinase